ncbi:MAG: O-succinylhomoserine sulfhydrylase [Micrococcales bacterium]
MTKRNRPWGYQEVQAAGQPDWSLHPDTIAVRAGLNRTGFGETSEALFLNSGFTYDSAEQAESAFSEETDHFLYSRFGNPTVETFEQRLAAVEGAEAAFASGTGMSAVFSALGSLLSKGDRVVASMAMFSSCYVIITEFLTKWGVEYELVRGSNEADWAKALSKPAKAVFIETPSNPMMEIVDIAMVSELAHKAGALVIVDNVIASPVLQKPLALGADAVMYSATKHIDGQGRVLGGAVVGSDEYINKVVRPFTRHAGLAMGAFEAWVLTKSLETMSLRVNRMAENALSVAKFLESNSKISSVRYPMLESHPQFEIAKKQMTGGGSTVSMVVNGDKAAAYKFMNALQVIDISNNLGDAKSLITHPASTTHRRLGPEVRAEVGITDSTLRLSVGLENISDLIRDLEQALG